MSASIQRRIDRLAKSCGIDFAAFDEAACPCARERFVPSMPTIMYGEDSWGLQCRSNHARGADALGRIGRGCYGFS